jgi:glycosyltransferase involved in cell wall biosynthesis
LTVDARVRPEPPTTDPGQSFELPDGCRPRIAYFTEGLLPWIDGVSRTLGQLFDTLETRHRDFRVYAPIAGSDQYVWGARVRKLPSVPFPLYRDYRVSLPDHADLEADLDCFEPDLVHVCSPTLAGAWAQSYARARRIPVVASFHTNFPAYFPYYRAGYLSGLAWRGLRWFHNRCQATFAPAASVIRELEYRGIENVRLWSPGIDCSLYTPAARDRQLRAQLGADDKRPVLLLVSRLVKEKDLLDLVEMDRILRRKGLDYRFVVVGDGPLRKRLERGLPEAHFAGLRSGFDLARWYASADLFVFPSTTETFGNVVQEAMASGLASVVVDRGGPACVIEPGVSGLVARAKEPADLAEKVAALLRDPGRRRAMGEQGRQLALTRSWQEVNAGLLREYDAICAGATALDHLASRTLVTTVRH